MIRLLAVVLLFSTFMVTLAQTGSRMTSKKDLPPGYWPLEKSQPIIDKTQTIRLATDLSHLSAGERKALERLIEVGKIFQSLYEKQRHPQALVELCWSRATGQTPGVSGVNPKSADALSFVSGTDCHNAGEQARAVPAG